MFGERLVGFSRQEDTAMSSYIYAASRPSFRSVKNVSRSGYFDLESILRRASLSMGSVPAWGTCGRLTQTEDAWIYSIPLPGVNEEQLEVSVEGTELHVKAERSQLEPGNGTRFVRRERTGFQLEEWFQLPPDANAEELKARLSDGVLLLTLPKVNRRRKVEVSVDPSVNQE
jgi:HSP20 family protein